MPNPYCELLKIDPPRLEAVCSHPEANVYALLIVALLERGGPMTLADVAARFEAAGVAPAPAALASLRRCRPARAPVYRDGDLYSLDPHDDDADLWAFRLGLRPPKAPLRRREAPPPPTLPGPEVPLTEDELDEAWRDATLYNTWSARRLALAVLDASGEPMRPADVVAAVGRRTRYHALGVDVQSLWSKGSPVCLDAEGRWAIDHATAPMAAVRAAVREKLAKQRRYSAPRVEPGFFEQYQREREARVADRAAASARQRHVIVYGYPPTRPKAVALLDVEARELKTFVGSELADASESLAAYDVLAGIEIRALLRALGVDAENRRHSDLRPPQKTMKINKRGRALKITSDLLIRGTCGISRPLAPDKLKKYLAAGEDTKLRRRLEADVKAVYALYEYGRLHHRVRLRWGFIDKRLPAPWVHPDDPGLSTLKAQAHRNSGLLEVVVGSAPGWADPWSRAILAQVIPEPNRWGSCGLWLYDRDGCAIQEEEIQLARRMENVAEPGAVLH